MIDIDKMEIDPLGLYREAFRIALSTKSDCRFSNATVSHAIVLIEELLNAAKSTFDIYCRSLGADVWCTEPILSALARAFDRGVRFRVVVQRHPDEGNAAFKFFKDRQIIVRQDNASGVESNFVIADGESFRCEIDNRRREGCAYAVNREYTDILNGLFESLYEHSTRLDG